MAVELKQTLLNGHRPQPREGAAEADDRMRPLSLSEREWKENVYHRLLKVMDLALIGGLEDREARRQIREICDRLLDNLISALL